MAVKAKKKAGSDADAGGRVVLLVENDEGASFDRTGTVLRGGGHQVVHLTAFTAALDLLRSPRRIDLLVAATRLPRQPSGFTLARQAQRLRPALPVVYVASTAADAASPEAARALGPVLPPGADASVMLSAVQQALAAKPPS